MISIRIGLKSVYLLCVVLLLHSCGIFEDDLKRLFSSAYIVNNTSDTVFLVPEVGFMSYFQVSESLISPGDTFSYRGGNLTEYQDGDALDAILSDASLVRDGTCYLFAYTKETQAYVAKEISDNTENPFVPDSLSVLHVWEPPLKEMGEDIHHFFNRSSWVIKPRETDDGGFSDKRFDVFFTITEDDIKQE